MKTNLLLTVAVLTGLARTPVFGMEPFHSQSNRCIEYSKAAAVLVVSMGTVAAAYTVAGMYETNGPRINPPGLALGLVMSGGLVGCRAAIARIVTLARSARFAYTGDSSV